MWWLRLEPSRLELAQTVVVGQAKRWRRNCSFDREHSVRVEVSRRILEATYLFVLGEEVEQRVVDDVDGAGCIVEGRSGHVPQNSVGLSDRFAL